MSTLSSRLLLAGTLLAGTSGALDAQQTTFRACIVPQVGAMYLIDLPGLPTGCLSEAHEEISWSEAGAPGDGSVGTTQLADGAVTAQKLAPGSVGRGALTADAVGGGQIADGSITAADLAPGAVEGVGAGSIGAEELADAAVTTPKLAPGSVTSDRIGARAVGTAHLAIGAVGSDQISDGSIRARDLVEGAIRSAEVFDNSLTVDDLGPASVGSSELADGSVRARHIRTSAVGSDEVVDNSLTADDLQASSVRSNEIADGTIQRRDIQAGAVGIQWQEVVGDVEAVFSAEVYDVQIDCPAGWYAVGGGFAMVPQTVLNSVPIVQRSHAVDSDTWRVQMYNGAASTILWRPRVVCIRIVP